MKALVVGGFAAKTHGSWAKALQQHCGIEITHAYGADNEFKGLPSILPADVDVVLTVIGTCSHKASNRAKAMAQQAGVRWESVSKDSTRAVQHLRRRGYLAALPATPPAEVQVRMGEPTWLVEAMQQDNPEAQQEVKVEVEQEVEVSEYADWLDFKQVRELLPDLQPSSFYKLAGSLVKRDEVRERRTRIDAAGRSVTHNALLWTLSEVEAVEALAKKRGLLDKPRTPTPEPEPVVFATTFTKAPAVHAAPEPVVLVTGPELTFKPVLSELRDHRAEVLAIMESYAHKHTQNLQAQLAEVIAERDTLREQLAKIKSALGVG